MTNNITGIDIRKALLAAGMRPSDYNEQAIFDYMTTNGLTRWDTVTEVARYFTPEVISNYTLEEIYAAIKQGDDNFND